jgi:hypothetical protein
MPEGFIVKVVVHYVSIAKQVKHINLLNGTTLTFEHLLYCVSGRL